MNNNVVILQKTDLTELLDSLSFSGQRKWITAKEAAIMLGIKASTLRNMKKENKLKYTKVENHYLYDKKWIEDILEKRAFVPEKSDTPLADKLRRKHGLM